MIVKDKFDLIKGVDNILTLSASSLGRATVENGPRKLFVVLELMKKRIKHFTKNRIFNLIANKKEREIIRVVALPNYMLPVSYNKPTKQIIINVSPFGVDDVTTARPSAENLYASLVYGITFSDIASGKAKPLEKYSVVISNYLVGVLLRLFGKDYGLLGRYAKEIIKLKFLVNCFVLASFYGVKPPTLYRKASAATAYNYKEIEPDLRKFNFQDINEFIRALNVLGVMPNLNRHLFAAKVVKKMQFSFLPALEDIARFFAILTTSNISGSNVVPTYIYKYNERDFNNVLEFSKGLFKRG